VLYARPEDQVLLVTPASRPTSALPASHPVY
jgi:hypothetical protein